MGGASGSARCVPARTTISAIATRAGVDVDVDEHARAAVAARFGPVMDEHVRVLASGLASRGSRAKRRKAALGVATSFHTFRSLVGDHGLDADDAAKVATAMVVGV